MDVVPNGNTKEEAPVTQLHHTAHTNSPASRRPQTGAVAGTHMTPVVHQWTINPSIVRNSRHRQQHSRQHGGGSTDRRSAASTVTIPGLPKEDDVVITASFDTRVHLFRYDEVAEKLEEDAAAVELVVGSAVVIATGFSMANIAPPGCCEAVC